MDKIKKKKNLCPEVSSILFHAKGMMIAETSGGAHCIHSIIHAQPYLKKKKYLTEDT